VFCHCQACFFYAALAIIQLRCILPQALIRRWLALVASVAFHMSSRHQRGLLA